MSVTQTSLHRVRGLALLAAPSEGKRGEADAGWRLCGAHGCVCSGPQPRGAAASLPQFLSQEMKLTLFLCLSVACEDQVSWNPSQRL